MSREAAKLEPSFRNTKLPAMYRELELRRVKSCEFRLKSCSNSSGGESKNQIKDAGNSKREEGIDGKDFLN